LFLTTEPPIVASEYHVDSNHPTEENRALFEAGLTWANAYNVKFANKRKVTPFVCSSAGKAVLITR
jgi:hypothetical protein